MVVSRAMLSYASISGARTASVSGTLTSSDVQNAIFASAPMLGLTSSNVTIAVDGVATSSAFTARTAGQQITVTVTYRFQPAVNLGGMAVKNWTATTQAVVE
jgi:hypothetical protein